ncbi:hypothetical protein BKA65DRAFT_180824 [Rhexocercosporidium sp. MPI-PUGE-AT-0058]|nr:hypothetical protein BKA65DRAFT_180824 [Rhexocercosporidium sp. MPI-PUGE-AT-0058]
MNQGPSAGTHKSTSDINCIVRHDAWEQARTRYMQDLSPKEKEIFANATLDNIFHSARDAFLAHESSSSSRTFITKLQPLIESIAQYGSALDVISNAASLVLCPLWGSLRVILHLASQWGKYFERLVEMFAQINDILPRFRTYESLYSNHPRVTSAVSKVYLDILNFCTLAKAVFRKGAKSPFLTTVGIGLKLVWRSFEQQFGEALDGFQRRETTVEKEIELAQRIESMTHQDATAETLTKLADMEQSRLAQKKTEREETWFGALRSSDYEFNKDKNPERVPRTCEWLLNHEKYKAWLESQHPGMVLVSADPGCGKSVLSRFLVDNPDLAGFDPSGALCYFFFKDDSEESKSAYHALSAILHQLFYQKRYLLRLYAEKFIDEGRLGLDDMWRLLAAASMDNRLSSITCIIDGLDECASETRTLFIQKLAQFSNSPASKSTLRFLVTSRPYTHIRQTFRKYGIDIQKVQVTGEGVSEKEDISSEIGLVIDWKIKQFREARQWSEIDDDAHEVLAEKLSHVINRTYLWISLVFPELEMYAGASKRDLIAILDTLPQTVTEAYEKILDRSLNRAKATKLLHIVTAAIRPLSLPELNMAMALDAKDRCETDVCLTPSQSFPTHIRDLCGLFIEIIRGNAYLVHQSAKDFLQRTPHIISPSSNLRWEHSLQVEQSHQILALVCMRYLSFDDFNTIMSPTPEKRVLNQNRARRGRSGPVTIPFVNKHVFLTYARSYWVEHFNLAVKDEVLREVAKQLWLLEEG